MKLLILICHHILAKVFELIVSMYLGKYIITNTNASSFQTKNTITISKFVFM